MKIAIVYYSYTGTTKKYVNEIKNITECDLIEIKPENEMKSAGRLHSYLKGGMKVFKKESPKLKDYNFNKDDYDFIIIASPVWAFTYPPAIKSFLENEKISGKRISYFVTHRGGPKDVHNNFKMALEGNEITHGLDLNAKDDEEENIKRLENWLSKILK